LLLAVVFVVAVILNVVKDPEEHHATTAAEDLSAHILTPPQHSSTITFCHGTQDKRNS